MKKAGDCVSDTYTQFLHQGFTTLDAFAENLGQLLACPITIENNHHHLLAYSEHGEGTDSARVATIIGRKVPSTLIHRFWKEGIMTSLNQSPEPVLIAGIPDVGLGRRVALSIRDKLNQVIGYIWVSEATRVLTVYEQQWMKRVAIKAASLLIKKGNVQGKASTEEKLWKLLTNTYIQEEVPEETKLAGAVHTIFMIDFENKMEHLTQCQVIIEQTTALYMFDGRYMIAFLSNRSIVHSVSHLVKQLPENLIMGCGNPSSSIDHVARSYEQAKAMLILKQRYPHELKNALFYYEAGALRYIQPYEEKAYLIGDHPAIVILEEYDLLNQTSLLETVMVYVKNNGHVSSTAKALHIHLNSLQYRLKRITDLTGLQLKDPTERIGIYLDLHRRQ